MLDRIATTLNARTLLALAGVVVGFFAVAAIDAALFGQDPANPVADTVGAIGWFGWLIGAAVLLVAAVVSLAARALGGGER